jgi:hypothetical protein
LICVVVYVPVDLSQRLNSVYTPTFSNAVAETVKSRVKRYHLHVETARRMDAPRVAKVILTCSACGRRVKASSRSSSVSQTG